MDFPIAPWPPSWLKQLLAPRRTARSPSDAAAPSQPLSEAWMGLIRYVGYMCNMFYIPDIYVYIHMYIYIYLYVY